MDSTDVLDLASEEDLLKLRKRIMKDDAPKGVEWALVNAIRLYCVFSVKLEALQFATRDIRHSRSYLFESGPIRDAHMVIENALKAKRNEAWKDLAMLAHLCNVPALRKEAVRIATSFVRGEHSAIMHFLDWNGDEPGVYYDEERTAFRKEILDRFKIEVQQL